MPTIIPTVWTIGALFALFLSSIKSLAIFSLGFVFLIFVCQTSLKTPMTAFKWSFPFLFPLLIVHGIINPSFPVAYLLGDFLPIRTTGIVYALSICCKIFILTSVVVSWKYVDPEKLMSDAIKIKIPDNLVIMIAVSSAIIHAISGRIQAVYLAQQARGIPAGPGFFARMKAVPAVILPVITSTLMEAHARGTLMANRGLGTTQIVFPEFNSDQSYKTLVLAFFIVPLFITAYLLK